MWIFISIRSGVQPNKPCDEAKHAQNHHQGVVVKKTCLQLAMSGLTLSYYMYMVNPALPAAILRTFAPLHTLLVNKYYLDDFNEKVLARGSRALASVLWKRGDQGLIDGLLVNGSWKVVAFVSRLSRQLQGYRRQGMQGHGHCAMKLLLQLPHGRMKIGVDVNGAFEEVAIEHGFYGEVANQNRGDGQQDQRQGESCGSDAVGQDGTRSTALID